MNILLGSPYFVLCLAFALIQLTGCEQKPPLRPTLSPSKKVVTPIPRGHGTPSTAPILRVETGMHNDRISRVGVDERNRFIVTASNDKTVRVWELESGQLIRTLRPPIGDGNEGKIFAVAISPDGKTVACGGWTGKEWDKSFSVYIFDRLSGRLVKRLTQLPSSIAHLTYSPDNRLLVATFHGRNGIRVYRTSDYKLLAEDRSYGAESYWADFDHTGRIVTSSYDGFIRLYSHDFRLITREKLQDGKRPFSVSFHPTGSKIAVGFEDSLTVNILSGKNLSPLYSLSAKSL